MHKPIKVSCNDCKRSTDESIVELQSGSLVLIRDNKTYLFVNIEEDIQGRDVLTFVCPYCNTTQKSYRV
jgi:hypothetical protein